MADRRIVEEWLNKADEDFQFASTALDEGNEFFAQICFHFQQSAEKYLKAFMIFHDLELRKTHSLEYLLKLCCKINTNLADLDVPCDVLEDYYIETRYPVHWPSSFSKKDTEEAKSAAKAVGDRIKSQIRFSK
jgi:HEPN domain-containing protein